MITTVHCMYCSHTWQYTGSNPSNICCPACKNRLDITKGKAMHFNDKALRIDNLESRIDNLMDIIHSFQTDLSNLRAMLKNTDHEEVSGDP